MDRSKRPRGCVDGEQPQREPRTHRESRGIHAAKRVPARISDYRFSGKRARNLTPVLFYIILPAERVIFGYCVSPNFLKTGYILLFMFMVWTILSRCPSLIRISPRFVATFFASKVRLLVK